MSNCESSSSVTFCPSLKTSENQFSSDVMTVRLCLLVRWTHCAGMMTLSMLWDLTPSSALPGELTFLKSSFVLDQMESNDDSW